ncbi:hypothetical protein E2C01_027414 [Portunus trituberculatus]|uniref:Uncharacterized protein n=1 Tax=Portunus trituberculatus TaxID=210409 RepID=A0A5B7EI26_PORTR|nr:hypothetical protein [Portunus trituberculatus]
MSAFVENVCCSRSPCIHHYCAATPPLYSSTTHHPTPLHPNSHLPPNSSTSNHPPSLHSHAHPLPNSAQPSPAPCNQSAFTANQVGPVAGFPEALNSCWVCSSHSLTTVHHQPDSIPTTPPPTSPRHAPSAPPSTLHHTNHCATHHTLN